METDFLSRTEPVEVVVANREIPLGETFSTENIAKKSIPRAAMTRRHVMASDFELLIGAKTRATLESGETILWSDVEEPFEPETFSMTIPKGAFAMTMSVDSTSSFAGLVRPGDHVNLFIGKNQGPGGEFLRRIEVIAVDKIHSRLPSNEENGDFSTVTVAVTQEQGKQIASASKNGSIQWFLCHPDDEGTPPTPLVKSSWDFRTEIYRAGRLSSLSPLTEVPAE